MRVVDAHHHFLDPDRIEYPFLRFLPQLAQFAGAEELEPLLREAGVALSVAVQAADSEEETRFLLEQAEAAPWVAGVVGWVPLADPGRAAAALDRHAETRLCGIRHLIHDEPDDDWVVQEPVLDSLGLLAERGLAFDLSAFNPRHISHVMTFARRVPELDVVLCHMGFPRLDQQQWEPWAGSFAEAARNPRCVVKISGLDMTVGGLRRRALPTLHRARPRALRRRAHALGLELARIAPGPRLRRAPRDGSRGPERSQRRRTRGDLRRHGPPGLPTARPGVSHSTSRSRSCSNSSRERPRPSTA